MPTEDLKTLITAISVVVATASLSFSLYQYRQKQKQDIRDRNTVPPVQQRQEVRTSLGSIVQRISSSEIFSVLPSEELWTDGFASLEDARAIFANADINIGNSPVPPPDIKMIVHDLLGKVKAVIKYRDSLTKIVGERGYASEEALEKWPDQKNAEAALHDLQQFVRSRETKLTDYLATVSA